jgi:predicted ATPase
MWTQLDDSLELDPVDDPALVLSSSQLNVLAVVLFLSLNLGMSSSPLMTMALDDPLQSLDNVNLLGLADLLRRVATQRQVLVSTHDPALADLLERKLRPVEPGQRTLRVELRDWTVDGPHVEVHNVPTDSPELRLVATG